MELEFRGRLFEWRGPAPFVFVAVPGEQSEVIAEVAPLVTYGWGVIPATITIGATTWTTSLFPKDGGYLVPLKVAIRRAEHLDIGDAVDVTVALDIDPFR